MIATKANESEFMATCGVKSVADTLVNCEGVGAGVTTKIKEHPNNSRIIERTRSRSTFGIFRKQ